ncbi:eukaryotic translation initiation factor 3 subunit 3, putative [Eimeria necatrix]|uniref:Eukaryotic translation initiation factor 3 subunit 3, putative n=1 Tax=Eimeria necatrix TaxID=51315 RepID=U6MWJ1_9EIME|nr:eukaryotic translation initiation factor 3 subunit 3, putative [Eimeria necatrix]CDJ68346.1 eukaryotic translation initiation factor 3 subunit 3, putative [Eimeria necatrix]
MSNKYVPPHLRGAAGGGAGAAAAAGTAAAAAAAAGAASRSSGESAATVVNNLLRAAAAADEGGPQGPLEGGPGGAPLQGEAKGPWGSWGRGAPLVRSSKQQQQQQQRSAALRVVDVDSLVLMKIIKHWRDFHPLPVNGQLLGTEVRDKLEVTNCFPLPQKKEVLSVLQQEKGAASAADLEERVDEEFDRHQDRMAELMHDVKVDCFTVGWYLTAGAAAALQREIVESLAAYQQQVDKAVLLAFDPAALRAAKNPLTAFRVNPKLLHALDAEPQVVAKIQNEPVLIQVPVSLRNAFLTDLFLGSPLGPRGLRSSSCCWGESAAAAAAEMEKSLWGVCCCLEGLGEEQERLQRYQRESLRQQQQQKQQQEKRRLENDQRRLRGEPLLPTDPEGLGFRVLEAPSLLPVLLLHEQTQQQTKDISAASADTLSSLFLLTAAAKQTKEEASNPK